MRVTGILSISNGAGLQYPFPVVISSLASLCDNVLVGLDPSFPADFEIVRNQGFSNVEIISSKWDRDNRKAGTEIAWQMQKLVASSVSTHNYFNQNPDWVVVMQADEVLHEADFAQLRGLMQEHVNTDVNGFSMERAYFWRDLQTIRTDWNAKLVRIFKPEHFSFMAPGIVNDGMFSGQIRPGRELELPFKIYHYSRVDSDPARISRRVRNLDGFFHPEENLIPVDKLPDYDFAPRQYDNFHTSELPKEVAGSFARFEGTHPAGIVEWYNFS